MDDLTKTVNAIYGTQLEKVSADLMSLAGIAELAGLGLASHVGMNAVYAGLKSAAKERTGFMAKVIPKGLKTFLPRMEEAQMVRGIQNGMSGETPSILRRSTEKWFAPEFMAHEHIGEAIGRNLPSDTAGRMKALSQMQNVMADNPGLKDTPVLKYLSSAAKKVSDAGIPEKVKPSPVKNALKEVASYAVGAPLAYLAPAKAAVHLAVNQARTLVPHTPMGKRYVADVAWNGVLKGVRGDKTGIADHLTDLIVSPMARDPGVIAKNIVEHGRSNPRQVLDSLSPVLKGRLSDEVMSVLKGASGLEDAAGATAGKYLAGIYPKAVKTLRTAAANRAVKVVSNTAAEHYPKAVNAVKFATDVRSTAKSALESGKRLSVGAKRTWADIDEVYRAAKQKANPSA